MQTPPPAHLACGPKDKDGNTLCMDAYGCHYYKHHDGRIYRIFNCAKAYPK